MTECACGNDHGAAPRTAIDPVCGTVVDTAMTAHHAGHAGQSYHFCRAACRERFEADPGRYARKAGPSAFCCEAEPAP
ncbi:YHS domain-containing protein [Roseococcus sp.]|uniref:YHS domain-containing protein n=1 Tax=Roseococcus sp. TaxID=2109646 RepID=UPI003BA98016